MSMTAQKDKETGAASDQPLSENSPVRLGLILTVVSLIAGGIIAAVAVGSAKISEFSTKLDSIQMTLTAFNNQVSDLARRFAEHESADTKEWKSMDTRMSIQEQVGSKPLRDLKEELGKLQRDFEIEQALNNRRAYQQKQSNPATISPKASP